MRRREFLCCVGCAGIAGLTGCAVGRRAGAHAGPTVTDPALARPEDYAYCGVVCGSCDVFNATVHGDEAARLRAHKVWEKTAQRHWGMETLDPAILDCTGCRERPYVKHHGYGRCPISRCARRRRVASCGLCPEWRQCDLLSEVFTDEPAARRNLEAIARRFGDGTGDGSGWGMETGFLCVEATRTPAPSMGLRQHHDPTAPSSVTVNGAP